MLSILKSKAIVQQLLVQCCVKRNFYAGRTDTVLKISPAYNFYIKSNNYPVRLKSTDSKPEVYKAAILEEFNKPLIVTKIKSDTPLGTEMVRQEKFLFGPANLRSCLFFPG